MTEMQRETVCPCRASPATAGTPASHPHPGRRKAPGGRRAAGRLQKHPGRGPLTASARAQPIGTRPWRRSAPMGGSAAGRGEAAARLQAQTYQGWIAYKNGCCAKLTSQVSSNAQRRVAADVPVALSKIKPVLQGGLAAVRAGQLSVDNSIGLWRRRPQARSRAVVQPAHDRQEGEHTAFTAQA